MTIRLSFYLFLFLVLVGCGRQPSRENARDGRGSTEVVSVRTAPNWIGVEDALVRSKYTGQPLLVFVYTDWCGWCDRTVQTTFQDQEVLRYLRENFQSVRLNAESGRPVDFKGRQFTEGLLADLLGASGFPTFIFLDSDGMPVYRTSGYRAAAEFLELLRYVADKGYSG